MKNKRPKLVFMTMFFLAAIGYLFFEMASIQHAYGEEYQAIAIRQQVYGNTRHSHVDRPINPNRGSILDRNGQVMAHSHTVYNVFIDARHLWQLSQRIDARSVTQMEAVVTGLYEVLGVSEARLFGYIGTNSETGRPYRDTHFLIIERQVSAVSEARLRAMNLRHVHAEEDTVRSYPAGSTTGNIVGFLSGDNSHWGLEGSLNHFLVGTPGREVRMFDATGSVATHEFRPVTGYTVTTTLDLGLQHAAVEVARQWGTNFEAESAQVIIKNPNTGEILVMAQYPNFDNNDPFNIELINSPRVREELYELSDGELMNALFGVISNDALGRSFEPGSTFKAVIAAAALEEGLTHPGEIFFCPGFIDVSGVRIHCWTFGFWGHGHGHVSLEDAMSMSCNVSHIILGQRLGRDQMYDYMRDFGIGQLTGIDIRGEQSFSALTYSRHQLNPVEVSTSAMGQGFNVTSIQMLNAFSAVINGGYLVTPHIISSVISEDEIILQNTPMVRRNVLSRETSAFWRDTMVGTLELDEGPRVRGTGIAGRIEGFRIGGKTGTAEQGIRSDLAHEQELVYSMIGYLPANDPQYIVMVVVDRPRHGGAAPSSSVMLREVMEAIIRQRAVVPYTIEFHPRNFMITVEDYTQGDAMAAIRRITEKGLIPEVVGSGNMVTHQLPLEGSVVSPDTRVIIYLADAAYVDEMVTVPDVIGMSLLHARERLQTLGIGDNIINMSDEPQSGQVLRVINQMPIEGVRLPAGSEITLIVDVYE